MSSACSADEPAAFRSIGQPLTEAEVHAAGLVPEEWIGDALGVGIGTWTYLGPVEWVPADQVDETYAQTMATAATVDAAASSEPASLGTATRRFIYVDMIGGEAYRVEFPTAALDAIAAAVESEAAALDNVPQAAFEPEPALMADLEPAAGISGSDDRVQVWPPIQTVEPLPSIALKNALDAEEVDLGSGVMIGERSVLTAAHNLIDLGKDDYVRVYETSDFGFTPGRNGDYVPYFMTPIKGMYVPEEATLPGQSAYHYHAYDYAIAYLAYAPLPAINNPPPPPYGWMQRSYLTDYGYFAETHEHVGYPDCNHPDAPGSPCEFYGMYWDPVGECFTNTDSNNIVIEDGLATVRAHDCDTSPGHSGGAIYYFRGGVVPTVTGVHVGGNNGSGFVNIFRRMTPTSLSNISTWVCLASSCI